MSVRPSVCLGMSTTRQNKHGRTEAHSAWQKIATDDAMKGHYKSDPRELEIGTTIHDKREN